MRSTQQQARVAGFLYLLLALSAPIGLVYVPSKLIVSGNATATAENLRASGGLLRIGIASELFHQVVGIFLVLALYRLFKEVDEALAKQVVILGALVSVPIVFVNALNEIAALVLVSGAGRGGRGGRGARHSFRARAGGAGERFLHIRHDARA